MKIELGKKYINGEKDIYTIIPKDTLHNYLWYGEQPMNLDDNCAFSGVDDVNEFLGLKNIEGNTVKGWQNFLVDGTIKNSDYTEIFLVEEVKEVATESPEKNYHEIALKIIKAIDDIRDYDDLGILSAGDTLKFVEALKTII
jgi:hypothetical protein